MKGPFYGSIQKRLGLSSKRSPRHGLAEQVHINYIERLRFRYCKQSRRQHSILYLRYHKNYGTARRVDFYYFVYSKLFSTRKNKKDTRQISRNMGKYHCRITWYGNTVLFVFLYSTVYWIYKCRFAAWRYIILFDFFTNG